VTIRDARRCFKNLLILLLCMWHHAARTSGRLPDACFARTMELTLPEWAEPRSLGAAGTRRGVVVDASFFFNALEDEPPPLAPAPDNAERKREPAASEAEPPAKRLAAAPPQNAKALNMADFLAAEATSVAAYEAIFGMYQPDAAGGSGGDATRERGGCGGARGGSARHAPTRSDPGALTPAATQQ
jgi:hypothetical protein